MQNLGLLDSFGGVQGNQTLLLADLENNMANLTALLFWASSFSFLSSLLIRTDRSFFTAQSANIMKLDFYGDPLNLDASKDTTTASQIVSYSRLNVCTFASRRFYFRLNMLQLNLPFVRY